MSTCNITVGRHNLDTSSLEKVAQQLSELFDINVNLGMDGRNEEWATQSFITEHQGRPTYTLSDLTEETESVFFELCGPINENDKERLPFFLYGNI